MSYLSIEQIYLLSVLHEIGCLRKNQAAALLRRQFQSSDIAIASIIRQLKKTGKIREYGNIISVVKDDFGEDILQAVDLILAFFPNGAIEFVRASAPFLALAYNETYDQLVMILHVPEGKEKQRSLLASNAFSANEVQGFVIMLLENAEQREQICVRSSYCLIAYQMKNEGLRIEKARRLGGERDHDI